MYKPELCRIPVGFQPIIFGISNDALSLKQGPSSCLSTQTGWNQSCARARVCERAVTCVRENVHALELQLISLCSAGDKLCASQLTDGAMELTVSVCGICPTVLLSVLLLMFYVHLPCAAGLYRPLPGPLYIR
ncbi:uncharacterized protein LOC121396191 isoform X2 [Xenopus laevis]|nr:uncharacterized protein LOC121396191 isoform X2 [Xenopus laevis]